MRSAKPSASCGSAIRRSSWAASVSASRGSNSRPELAVAQRLLVLRQARDDRHRAAGEGAQHQLRRGRCARGGRDRDPRSREVLGLRAVRRPGERDAVAQPARQRHRRGAGRVAQPDRRVPVEVGRQPPQRAQEQPQRAALLFGREHDLRRLTRLRRRARDEIGAGLDDAVVAGEVALDEVARGAEAGRAAVEAPEQQRDDPARDLRREEALGGRVEAADVQRARVAQRGRGGARRERLVHVHEVELGVLEQILERARDVERQRHRAAAAERQALADGQHRGAAGGIEERVGVAGQRLDARAALADQLARLGGGDHHHAVPAGAELVREPLDVAVDLVVLLPRPRRDLGDRVALAWHAGEDTSGPASLPAPNANGRPEGRP